MLRLCRALAFTFSALAYAVTGAVAQSDAPQLHTHQSYIEQVMRPTTLDVTDPFAVFAFVLNSLPDRVKIYPTENYYYFTFSHNGLDYAGNIRLDASDRDHGKVQFAYYEQTTGWLDNTPGFYKALDASDGVKLEKIERFVYRLTYKEKSIIFELNDLSQVKPPANALAPNETFIGPVFDDSGVRFFLVFNAAVNNFLYILDETIDVADDLIHGPRGDRILVGKRTGFVFYRDHRRDRKILVGVYGENVDVNNYFDGPFDQLPDNFIKGETLREAILKVQPNLKGRIDRFGGTADGEQRYTIAPYLIYKEVGEFDRVDRCADRVHGSDASYYRCFILFDRPQDLRSEPSETILPSNARKQGAWGEPSPAK
ncbi:MAG TPA: hypothetical protein VFC45_07675 [Pseudolabrys sp.]|nr:hypothetical protein [Pseudolabrys sp.]